MPGGSSSGWSAALFAFAWLFRFNDPGGSFAALTDDHFFYLRGWQILFGDVPVRDFVDHGALLFYYVRRRCRAGPARDWSADPPRRAGLLPGTRPPCAARLRRPAEIEDRYHCLQDMPVTLPRRGPSGARR